MVFADCKKCATKTRHRKVKDSRPGRRPYYMCAICLDNHSKAYRKRHWCRYLATKANSRKIPGSIILTENMIESIGYDQKLRCALTKVRFDIESKWYRPSIDRIDSNKGYTLDNIRLVAWIVNHCRGNLTDAEFTGMCIKVAQGAKK